jgi:hypothetical protein
MTPAAHFRFVILGLVFLILYILNQLPDSYKVECNTDALLKCFTREREDGKRVDCGEWASRPEMSQSSTSTSAADASFKSSNVTPSRRSTRNKTATTSEPSTSKVVATQQRNRDSEFALWDAHVDRYSSAISVIRVNRAHRINNGEVYNPNIKGGRPPVVTASIIGKSPCW